MTAVFMSIMNTAVISCQFNFMLSLHNRSICCKVLCQVCDGVACDLHGAGRPGCTGGKLWEDADRVVDKIGRKARLADLFLREITRKLVDDGTNHLKMSQLLCADCGSPRATSTKSPCAARVTGRKRERKRECAKRRLASFL